MRFQRLEDLRIDADKTQEEILCFAEKVLNGRSTDVVQAKLLRDCAQSAFAPLLFLAHER